MTIRNNLMAINILNRLNFNNLQLRRASERLSSGLRINRAADDPAGLAISVKMRAQIRGLQQAVRNANDGISLLKTAEGALDETHAMLHRIKELTVQAANDTYTSEQRGYMQFEINQLVEEINRISKATDFNGIKLLDGSLSRGGVSNSAGNYGASFGVRAFSAAFSQHISVAASNAGVSVQFTTNAAAAGGEYAFWDSTGRNLTINLAQGVAYRDAQINTIIQNASVAETGQTPPAKVEFKSEHGVIIAANADTGRTVAGSRQTATLDMLPFMLDGGILTHADKITFTANQYGSHVNTGGVFSSLRIVSGAVVPGKEGVVIDTPAQTGVAGAAITLNLATGVEYSNSDIENLLRQAGFDYTVNMHSSIAPDGDRTAFFTEAGSVRVGQVVGSGGTGPASPPEITNISVVGWTDITPTLVTAGVDADENGNGGVAAVYRFDSAAIAALDSLLNPSNIGQRFSIFGIETEIGEAPLNPGFIGFHQPGESTYTGGITGFIFLGVNPPVNNPSFDYDWLVTWSTTGSGTELIATAKNVGAMGGNTVTIGSFTDGQGVGSDVSASGVSAGGGNGLTLQVGHSNADYNRVSVYIDAMDANAIGLSGIDVTTREGALKSMGMVDSAITAVSRQRAGLGAMQNRLEHTVNSLTNQIENLTEAESRIRDADMAAEMINYTKYSILQEVAMALLAQANQQPYLILQLLRSL